MFIDYYQTTNELEKAIKRTIAFFDLFDFPLTAPEITRYLDNHFSLANIIQALDGLPGVGFSQGQYFLTGRAEIVLKRQKNYNHYGRKFKIARFFGKLFALSPSVKAVFLSNVIGAHNLRDGSDLDFFIITKPKQIWLTRLYCAGLAALLNKRPHKNNKRDKICLSFYISSDKLDLNDLRLKPADPYFDYWLRSLVLLYNTGEVYEDFLGANGLIVGPVSKKIEKYQPHLKAAVIKEDKFSAHRISSGWERFAKHLQLLIMNPALKAAANNSSGVVISEGVLKFYLKDNRQEYLEKYGNKLQQVFAQND